MSENSSANGQIPDALKATGNATATPTAKTSTARKPVAKKATASTAKKAPAKEAHVADKIKALPRRRVWPD